MDKVFRVELSGDDRRYCELDLPATDYELLDALARLQLRPGDKPGWEFIEHTNFQFLHAHLTNECDLYQLNALATRLGQMDSRDKIAFEGLFNMEVDKKYGPISISTMIDLAYSTDCCHVVEGITTDAQLGEFYAENDFMPELNELPDSVFQLLDFDKLGEKMRFEDGGILVGRGYVAQHADLKQVYDTLTLVPKKPDYTFRLLIGRYPFETNDQPDKLVPLELPATQDQMNAVLEKLGLPNWEGAVVTEFDGAISDLDIDLYHMGGLDTLNELAMRVRQLDTDGRLSLYKAVLHAADCHDVDSAIQLADGIDEFVIDPEQRTPEEVAQDELRFTMGSDSARLLEKHVDLFAYGTELLAINNAVMTPYGPVRRRDGEMILTPADVPAQGGMQMQ